VTLRVVELPCKALVGFIMAVSLQQGWVGIGAPDPQIAPKEI